MCVCICVSEDHTKYKVDTYIVTAAKLKTIIIKRTIILITHNAHGRDTLIKNKKKVETQN